MGLNGEERSLILYSSCMDLLEENALTTTNVNDGCDELILHEEIPKFRNSKFDHQLEQRKDNEFQILLNVHGDGGG